MINQKYSFKLSGTSDSVRSASTVPRKPTPRMSEQTIPNENLGPVKIESDRDVVRCITCGMMQFRTRNGNCRRCLHRLTSQADIFVLPPEYQELPGDALQPSMKLPNKQVVENIGQRIRQLRESHGMTQSKLQALSQVSRSYLSRIESGQMTPSLGTLEKISKPLGIGLNRFFAQEANGETLFDDPFIQGLRPFLRQLDWQQWQSILQRLAAISDHVSGRNEQIRPMAKSQLALMENQGRRN